MWEQSDIPMKKINLDMYLTLHIKINSKYIINLNVKCKTLKLLEENIGETLHYVRSGDDL